MVAGLEYVAAFGMHRLAVGSGSRAIRPPSAEHASARTVYVHRALFSRRSSLNYLRSTRGGLSLARSMQLFSPYCLRPAAPATVTRRASCFGRCRRSGANAEGHFSPKSVPLHDQYARFE